jgi:hypothetical protein
MLKETRIARLPRLLAFCLSSLVAGLIATSTSSRATASELEPDPLILNQSEELLSVDGEHFGFTWSAAKGGDLTSIRLHDGARWHELVAPGRRRVSVPGILVRTSSLGTLGQFARGSIDVLEHAPGRVVVESRSRLATEAGEQSELELVQTFTVLGEGAVFVDLELELPEGSEPVRVERATIGWVVDVEDYTLGFWHWQRSAHRGSGFLEPQRTYTSPYCPNLGLAVGTAGNLSNQLQVIVESNYGLSGSDVSISSALSNGRSFVTRLHDEPSEPITLAAPYRYRNRWGFFLGRHPERSRLTGHRIAYWQEGEAGGMRLPSASALAAMAKCGATAVIVGETWGRDEAAGVMVPVSDESFRQFVSDAGALGLGCLINTVPGGDGEELGRWARNQGLAGLYLSQASAHYGVFSDRGTDFPARATFEWGQALRRGLGSDGLLIVHTGLESPDLSLGLLADGIAFGTERADWRAARATLANAYLGGTGYSTPCPLAVTWPMRSSEALAVAAATGSVPLIGIGYGAERSAYRAEFALPLWQLLRLVGQGPGVEVRTNGVRAVAHSSSVDFWSTVYRMSDQMALLVTANLSPSVRDSTGLALDFPGLGFSGEYDVEMIVADDLDSFGIRHLGRTANGILRTDAIARFAIRGFLFSRGEISTRVGMALDQGVKVGTAFIDRRVPEPVGGLAVAAVTGGLGLSWEPGSDNSHVASYRIYRSPDPDFSRSERVVALGEAFEETRYRDLTVAPGETWAYAVAAIDVAGNEGQPSPPAAGSAWRGSPHFSFSDSASVGRFAPVSGSWTFHDSAYGRGCTPTGGPFSLTLLSELELADVDLGVKVLDASGSPYSGGLVCRADDQGHGYALYLGGPQSSKLILARIDGQEMEPLATAPFSYFLPGRSVHTLRLVAVGSRLTGLCDDRTLVEATDSTYLMGRVGLVATAGHIHFDNLTINPGVRGD